MKKVAFYTLGCKLNFSETSTIARLFEKEGFKKVEFTDSPDIFVINTCSVTDNADKKCKKIVKEAKKISPNSFITIVGCYAQLKPKEISEIKGVDAVLGASEKFRLIELLKDFTSGDKAVIHATTIDKAVQFNASYSMNDRTRTFLKVQDGCNYSCTFCTIPLARGESRSDSIENILKSAQEIAQTETKEVVLTGVNIGDFGIQNGERKEHFADLVQQLDKQDGIERFRISSIEPNLLTSEIVQFVKESKRFVPHFHIPLQSGSNKILRLMKRRYQRELYAERISLIKSLMPKCCIGVDVITGFPGESDDDFKETLEFIDNLDVSYLHVFTYSERDNTIAKDMKESVPLAIRNKRTTILRNLSDKKRRFFYEQQLENEALVLFEDEVVEDKMYGYTENYVRVVAKYDPMYVNELKKVVLKTINSDGVVEVEEIEEILHH